MKTSVAIIGVGPAGRTASYLLEERSRGHHPGSRSDARRGVLRAPSPTRGFHDIGGHRFFSKSKRSSKISGLKFSPDDMLVRSRSLRIFYNGKFFLSARKPFEALINLGVLKSSLAFFPGSKYASSRSAIRALRGWVTNQFGKRLLTPF